MKKFSLKSFSAGLIFGLVGITTVFASTVIRSAQYKDTKVTVDGIPVSLKNPLVAITNESEPDANMYMPVRELLQNLGYQVNWDEESDTICLKSNVRVEGDTIIKHDNWKIGYPYGSIQLEEDPQTGAKWQCTAIGPADITLATDKYLGAEDGATDKKAIHRFNFSIPRTLPESDITITFEKILDGKKTGNKIIYEINLGGEANARKPVIYLYPTEKTDVTVSLDYDGVLDYTYPAYNTGWSVTAYPDGKLINHEDNNEYSYLFWEGHSDTEYDFSKGFIVKGEDTVGFLQDKLSYMGLTPKEYNEFIVYWLPQMQDNPYNFITFQQEAYTEHAKLNIKPAPDSMLRVFMAYKPLEHDLKVAPQVLNPFIRNGFTVVEWGGTIVNENKE